MTPGELIECGQLMQAHAAGTTSPEQVTRMRALMAMAKRDLPHDDPSTPDVDEGDTEIMRAMKRQARAEELAEGFCRGILALGLDVAAAVVTGLTTRLSR